MLLLIALGIGSVLYANNELKLLTDSLRRVIDEKHVFVKEKEDRINRIKCMLRSPGLTLEGEYRINLRLYNEYKKMADREEKTIFGGRLGEYKYYDMDATIDSVLNMCEKEFGDR